MKRADDQLEHRLPRPLAELSDAEMDDLAAKYPVDKPPLPTVVDEDGRERLVISEEGQVALSALLDRIQSDASSSAG